MINNDENGSFDKDLLKYIVQTRKKPIQHFAEIIGILKIGGFRIYLRFIESIKMPPAKLYNERLKIRRLENIYENYLKTKE